MGMGLVVFHEPYSKNEFHVFTRNQSNYYFVQDGFFETRHSFGRTLLTLLHISFIASLYLLLKHHHWNLLIIAIVYMYIAAIGITGGSHRLWAHRAFKAKFPLRLFLMLAQASAGVFSIRTWYIKHTAHHKWSDTDADPHNVKRGLFFSHGFWLFKRAHPLNFIKEQSIDDTQLMKDPLVHVNDKYFDILFILFGMVLPTVTGVLLTGSSWIESFLICYVIKHVLVSQLSSLLNSAAHLFGDKPYNTKIMACDDKVLASFTVGEGYHNYHHAFPSDYSTGEFGSFSILTYFIDVMAWIGQAYDLKKTSDRVIELTKENAKRMNQLLTSSHHSHHSYSTDPISSFFPLSSPSSPPSTSFPPSFTTSTSITSKTSYSPTENLSHSHHSSFRMTESLG